MYGDPKKNKAKVCSVKNAAGKTLEGVYVRVGEEGIYDVEVSRAEDIEMEEEVEDGEEALDSEEVEEKFQAAVTDKAEAEHHEVLSLRQTQEKAGLVRVAEAVAPVQVGEDDNSGGSSDSDGESNSSGSESHTNNGSSEEEAEKPRGSKTKRDRAASPPPPPKRRATGQKSASTSSGVTSSCIVDLPAHVLQQAEGHSTTLENYSTKLFAGEYQNVPPRQLQAVSRDMKDAVGAARRFVRALGKGKMPAGIENLSKLAEQIETIPAFFKNHSKISSMAYTDLVALVKPLMETFKDKSVPLYVATKLVERAVEAPNLSATERACLLDSESEPMQYMAAHAEEGANLVRKLLNKILASLVKQDDHRVALSEFMATIAEKPDMFPSDCVQAMKSCQMLLQDDLDMDELKQAIDICTAKKPLSMVATLKKSKCDAFTEALAKASEALRKHKKQDTDTTVAATLVNQSSKLSHRTIQQDIIIYVEKVVKCLAHPESFGDFVKVLAPIVKVLEEIYTRSLADLLNAFPGQSVESVDIEVLDTVGKAHDVVADFITQMLRKLQQVIDSLSQSGQDTESLTKLDPLKVVCSGMSSVIWLPKLVHARGSNDIAETVASLNAPTMIKVAEKVANSSLKADACQHLNCFCSRLSTDEESEVINVQAVTTLAGALFDFKQELVAPLKMPSKLSCVMMATTTVQIFLLHLKTCCSSKSTSPELSIESP